MKTQRKNTKTQSPSPQSSGRAPTSVSSSPTSDARLKVLLCLLLAAITLVAYWQVLRCGFITSYDDNQYVSENPFISKGLGFSSLTWAFTTFRCSNWHPLTWISHMVDYQLYGLVPTGHHATSLLFHVANTLILFLLLSRMTGAMWKSGFVAALFAVHPLHVESVAWIAERKDLLSTFFALITIYAYALYAKRPSFVRYVPVFVGLGLGLMCKPMLVSLPLVLLLLDYWPLDRAGLKWRLVWEKLPLLAMSAASCVITFIAQRAGGTMASSGQLGFGYRIGNAAISYMAYIVKTIWPSRLAVFYPPFGTNLPIGESVGAGVLLVAATVLILRAGCRRRYLTAGWLWYLITLVPVIGLVQVGLQAMADRYSYVPLVGLFIMLAWGVPDLFSRRNGEPSRLLPISALAVTLILAGCTWRQTAVWHDSFTLFDRAIRVTKDNYIAYNNRGTELVRQGRNEEGIADFTKAIEILPDLSYPHVSLGTVLIKTGKTVEGIDELLTGLRLGLDNADLRYQIALGYSRIGKLDLAAAYCQMALRMAPSFPVAHNLLGAILGAQGKVDEAISHLKSAAEEAPAFADPHGNLALAYIAKRDYAAAWKEVHLFQSKGGHLRPQFLADLSKRMPDPGR